MNTNLNRLEDLAGTESRTAFLLRDGSEPTSEARMILVMSIDDMISAVVTTFQPAGTTPKKYYFTGESLWKTMMIPYLSWDQQYAADPLSVAEFGTYSEMDMVEVYETPTHLDNASLTSWVDPKWFKLDNMMGTFDKQEREVSAYWVLKWAQTFGDEVIPWPDMPYDELVKWSKHKKHFYWNGLTSDRWKHDGSIMGGPSHKHAEVMVEDVEGKGELFRITDNFVYRCIWKCRKVPPWCS